MDTSKFALEVLPPAHGFKSMSRFVLSVLAKAPGLPNFLFAIGGKQCQNIFQVQSSGSTEARAMAFLLAMAARMFSYISPQYLMLAGSRISSGPET